MNFKLTCRNMFLLLLVILATIVFELSPMLKSGFFSDDCFNSMVPGILINSNTDVFTFTCQIVSSWINIGRVFPLAFYAYILFSVIHDFFTYHLLVLIAILVDTLLFGYFIKRMTNSAYVSLLSMLIHARIIPVSELSRSYPKLSYVTTNGIFLSYRFTNNLYLLSRE